MRLTTITCVASLYMPFEAIGFTIVPMKIHVASISRNAQREKIHNSRNTLQAFKIKNPFSNDEKDFELKSPFPPSEESSIDAESLFTKARTIIGSDFGARDFSLFDDDFIWIGPDFQSNILDKEQYLAATKFFDLRATFPDLDYRAHDFRLDPEDPLTVRFTTRTVGTMRGNLRLRKETLPPNGKRMICPPEVISMTFDPSSGKLKKLCSGFCMDRLVGNTNGLCGVKAAAAFAGKPPSEWDLYPPVNVLQRFFARPVKQLSNEESSFLAPFPESVMIQLTKGVIAANNGASDSDLLASSFSFCGPLVGPIEKDAFVEAFGGFNLNGGFPDLDVKYSNFRVDPYDPYRVWVDARGTGTRTGTFAGGEPNGLKYDGPPEAASYTFDDDGFCTRLTAGVVIDPTKGNTGGLGGVFGILYATGTPLPGIASRPLPEIFSRLSKRIISPLTSFDVDDIVPPGEKGAPSFAANVKIPSPPTISTSLKRTSVPKPPSKDALPEPKEPVKSISKTLGLKPKPPVKRPPTTPVRPSLSLPQRKPKPATKPKEPSKPVVPKRPSFSIPRNKPPSPSSSAKTAIEKAQRNKKEAAEKAKQEKTTAFAKLQKEKKETAAKAKKEKEMASAKLGQEKKDAAEAKARLQQEKKEAAEIKKQEKAETAAKIQQEKKEAAEKIKREKAEAAMKIKQERKEAAEKTKLKKMEAAQKAKKESTVAKSKKKTMVIGKPKVKKISSKTTAPKGVPTLSSWRRNFDKSVSGTISGSDGFEDGEQITTSVIVSGVFKPGNVVVTESGSKYFLE